MGRPTLLKARRIGANRRDFFKRSGTAVVALASVPLLSTPAAQANGAGNGAIFQHGVASGDPLADRVILWTRVTPRVARPSVLVNYVLALDPALTQVVARGRTKTNPDRDYTVKVDALRLAANTTYYYRFSAEGSTSPIGRTRTLPVGTTTRLRMAVVSCSNHAAGFFNAYRRIAERADLDLVVHLGDYLYEYGPNTFGSLRAPEPPNEMGTLSDYRTRHAQYKRDVDSQEVHRQHPMICIWDDHEITNDSWIDGAENHTPGTEGDWAQRVGTGLRAYYEWMPVRIPDATQPRRNQRAFQIGALVDRLMLEERWSGRSQQIPAASPTALGVNGCVQTGAFPDPTRTLLGAEQEAWLATRLRTSTAKWKFLGQGVMFAHLKLQGAPLSAGGDLFTNSDQWDGYQPARDRLYDVLKGDARNAPVDNCVVLTGDIHSSWANDLTQDPNNPNTATGGYNPVTGAGSRAVEFVGTSVSSPGLNDPTGGTAAFLRSVNPHMKYIDFNQRGYMLLDVTPQRAVCEWHFVDTVAAISNVQTFGVAFEVQLGSNHLVPSVQTTPRANPPQLAP